YVLNVTADAADLAAVRVEAPSSGVAGENVTIRYTVRNLSNATAVAPWVDSIYLATGDQLNPNARLITRRDHTSKVVGMDSYTEMVTVPLPGAAEGRYRVFVVADSQGRVPDANRDNNILGSDPIDVRVGPLHLGVRTDGTIQNRQDV